MKGAPVKKDTVNAGYRWFVVLLLSATMAFSIVDRFALSLLFEPIKADLQLSDTQLGMLHGIAFGLFYATMGIPIAWLIDRWSRKWMIIGGVACWSLMTALCGLARTFPQLLGARIGVGVGEATIAPAGYSLIADIVTAKRLASAISVFQMGSMLGGGLAFLGGGAVLAFVEHLDYSSWLVLGDMQPWQLTFMALALPGLPIAALFLLVREPLRSGSAGVAARPATGLLASFRQQSQVYTCLFVGNACLVAISYGNMTWVPAVMARQYGWDLPDVGYRFGLVMLFLAPIGVLIGGFLADSLSARGHARALPAVPLLAAGLTLVLLAASFSGGSAWQWFVLTALVQFATSMAVGTGPAAVVKVAPVAVRARLSALYVFTVNIVGLGLGPVLVGLLSDHVFHAEAGVQQSLRVFTLGMCLVSCVLLGRLFFSQHWFRALALSRPGG